MVSKHSLVCITLILCSSSKESVRQATVVVLDQKF